VLRLTWLLIPLLFGIFLPSDILFLLTLLSVTDLYSLSLPLALHNFHLTCFLIMFLFRASPALPHAAPDALFDTRPTCSRRLACFCIAPGACSRFSSHLRATSACSCGSSTYFTIGAPRRQPGGATSQHHRPCSKRCRSTAAQRSNFGVSYRQPAPHDDTCQVGLPSSDLVPYSAPLTDSQVFSGGSRRSQLASRYGRGSCCPPSEQDLGSRSSAIQN
jgi:hypothetical protein